MANLYTGKIKCNNKYKEVGVETGVTFEAGKKYQLQLLNVGYIREGEVGEGFLINSSEPFIYECKGYNLWVCSSSSIGINIAD